MILLFLAALVLRTLNTARNVDPGFDTQWTLASYVSTSSMGTPVAEREAFFRDLIARFEEFPWVQAATVAEQAPLSGHPEADLRSVASDEPVRATVARVVPGYFEALGMEIVEGRSLLPEDTVDAAGVVVVNESLAERLLGGESPVGWALSLPGDAAMEGREYEVVGVVRNAHQTSFPDEPGPVAYFSLPQGYYRPGNAFLLKVTGDPSLAARRMEEELRAVDPRIAIVNILPYSEVLEGFLYSRRMNAELFSVIAALALILVGAGIFGVMSLLVAGQRREIGIRLAIGAKGRDIARMVMTRVAGTVLLGIALGAGGAFLARRMVEALLWGVHPTDPLSLSLGVAVLIGAVALAAALPLRRALTVDPAGSLQAE
jgi:predicted permease